MQEDDKSFVGLTLSILFHIGLVLLILFMPKLDNQVSEKPTEITILDGKKATAFVDETQVPKKDLLEDLKEKAKFVSQFNKRVKEEAVAKRIARSKNTPFDTPALEEQQELGRSEKHGQSKAGSKTGQSHPEIQSSMQGLQPKPQTLGSGGPPGATEGFGKNLVMGSSSIAQYIPGIKQGSFTALNTDQFTYYTFFERMNEQLRQRWVSLVRSYLNSLSESDLARQTKSDKYFQIEVVLDNDGKYMKGFIHHSSGEHPIDMTAIDAFQAAAPFPNPPKGLVEDDGFIHLHYNFLLMLQPRTGLGAN
jgi:TonB C terminal